MEDDDSVRVLDCQGPQQAGAPHMQTEAKRARTCRLPKSGNPDWRFRWRETVACERPEAEDASARTHQPATAPLPCGLTSPFSGAQFATPL